MVFAHALMASEAGTHGFTAVEGHEAAFLFAASALKGMAAFLCAAGGIGRFFFRGAIVADGAAGLVVAGIAGNLFVRGMVESNRHAGRYFPAEGDGGFRIVQPFFGAVGLSRPAPCEGEKKGKDKKRFHSQSPGKRGNKG